MTTEHSHIISVLVENEFGVLARVAGLFSSKGYNIDSLTVSPTDDPSLSRMTIVTHGSDQIISQILKQLNKLVNVIRVEDLTRERHITREMYLLKLKSDSKAEILAKAEKYKARVLESSSKDVILELTGDNDDLQKALKAFSSHGILELVKTGKIAIQRGGHLLQSGTKE